MKNPPFSSRRFATSVSLTVLVITGFAVVRPSRETGISEELLWYEKVNSRGTADIVFVGDSRVLHGISPSAMQSTLPGRRILNLGFRSVPLNDSYLAFSASSLDPDCKQPIIAIAVSANSFTPRSLRDNGYAAELWRVGEEPPLTWPWLVWIQRKLKPLSLRETLRLVRHPRSRSGHYDDCHHGGWIAADMLPEDPQSAELLYRKRFIQNEVDSSVIVQSLDFVQACEANGIIVLGYRVPTTDAILEIESSLSGFDYDAYERRFKESGGHWLTVEQTGLKTYDGSHLNSLSAQEFSKRIAKAIQELMKQLD